MENLICTIKEKVAGRAIVMPVFGDAKSLATLALCVKALSPEKVYCVHIDHGMLRKNEAGKIEDYVKKLGIKNSVFVKCEHIFSISAAKNKEGRVIGPLSNVCAPEEKRAIIYAALNKAYKEAVKSFASDGLLVFGNHEIGGESIVEVGDDARRIALEAGADSSLVRQPFSVFSLAIRMICNDSEIALTTAQRESLYALSEKYSKEFSSRLAPLRSVGICNGERTYKSMAILSHRGLKTDFKKAFEIAGAINSELGYINRTLCRVDSSAHEAPFYCRPLHLTKSAFDILRKADAIVAEEFDKTEASQFFAVLLPLSVNSEKKYSVVIRAVSVNDFAIARALVPGEDFSLCVLENAVERIKSELGESVDMVLYDISAMNRTVIEWE